MHATLPRRGPSFPFHVRARRATFVLLLFGCAACGGASGVGALVPSNGGLFDNGLGSFFIATAHQNGGSNDLRITGLEWGRLVDVFETTGDPEAPIGLVFRDLLIDHSITASTLDFEFSANPVSGKEFVVVSYPRDSVEFQGVLAELTDTQPVPPKGLGVNVLPPFTAVARNSALVINFNDLIDADTVSAQTVRLLTGDPPSLPFEARIVPSTTHGALLGGTYHTTRVIVDFTVSTLEALDDPSLSVNTLGLPSAQQVNAPNAALRIATKQVGQFTLLTNLSGRALNFASAGPSDPTSPTLDVVRSFRSRGKTDVTGDLDNGFLPDEIPPSVLGTQGVFAQQNDPGDQALLDVTFLTPACVMPLRVGDILEFSGFVFQVVTPGQLAGNLVVNTRVVALVGDLETFGPSFGLFKTTWSPTLGAPPACFVRFDPQPGTAPATDVATQSTIIAEFSEPMDPARVLALKTLRVVYDEPPVADNPMFASVVGRVLPAADLKSYVFAPSLPLRHESGIAETYFVEISTDDPSTGEVEGVTDLAGNALLFGLPSAAFTLEATQATQKTAGYALRFADPQADEDGNGKPDIRGQYVIDPRQVVKPRGFQRFSVLVDDNQPLIQAMFKTAITIQTPLSDKGSKTQLVWRYIDMGFSLLDDQFHNLDLEGLSWASFASAVANDKFTNFS
ncbi:MAG TPA: Ig-like domain-containing protein, partial [Planctomycetota bacterium]|nr:Ig-like domain-containing protein [Planctomycetota bacterium]